MTKAKQPSARSPATQVGAESAKMTATRLAAYYQRLPDDDNLDGFCCACIHHN